MNTNSPKSSATSGDSASTFQAEPNPAAQTPMPKWLLPLIFIGGLVGFVLIVGRTEVARWHYASTVNALADERYDDAIESANNGLKWNPEYTELIALRATSHREQKDYAACLIDYDRMIAIESKKDPNSDAVYGLYGEKNYALQQLDRFDEAIANWDKVVEYRAEQYRLRDDASSQRKYAMSLNNRSYMEAQAHVKGNDKIDIKKSLADIEKAIEIRGVADDPVMVDTLGYLYLLNEKHEDALYQMTMAVQLTELGNKVRRKGIQEKMATVVDQRPYQSMMKQLDEQFSILLHHRGEVYEAMGETEKAEADIKRALELGYNPEEGIW